ncbi:sigma-54-dependent Fis family transcriptional regulator [Halomonas binhaiensis]|uniref:sigma-54-dependent Fis family transcriptional regulator n=1 Tax=Halomonas binhaiensis TaxID=2562282 RepID=UPI001F083D03|nr:sigma-54-dependent Fis family transcriptional regulator [Halomonas binhaiensis]
MSLCAAQRHHIDTLLCLGKTLQGATINQRDIIMRSWQRCLHEYQLDPSKPRPVRVVPQHILRTHQESVDELLHVGRAGVDRLYAQIASFGYVLLLTDHAGITVKFRGDKEDQHALRRAGLYLGADWNERYAGTCAVGTCLHEAIPLTCHQREHFDASHISLTGSSAPIMDPQGNIIAVLNISSLNSPRTLQSQAFALPLVIHCARMIEDAYFLHHYRNQLILRYDSSREFVHLNGRGLIAIDEGGNIIAANSFGRELIKAHQRYRPSLTSQTFPRATQLFDAKVVDLLSIPSNSDDDICAFRVRSDNSIVFINLIEPRRNHLRPRPTPAEPARPAPPLERLAGDDPAMNRIKKLAHRLRNESVNILISGDTGSGKTALAQAFHSISERAHHPFVTMNCASIPESLIERKLFGYHPGSIPNGQAEGEQGLIQQADGGTLFLNDVSDIPLHLQSRLLRVINAGELLPPGTGTKMDIRIIATTHRSIQQLVDNGLFRKDFYYRLNGAEFRLPPLRARADKHYVIRRVFEELMEQQPHRQVLHLRADAMSALLAYSWPGNIRQLKNALSFAIASADSKEITVQDLPHECLSPVHAKNDAPCLITEQTTHASLPDEQAEQLHALLRQSQWNISQAAKQLGVSRPTIYRRMQRYGLVAPNRQG